MDWGQGAWSPPQSASDPRACGLRIAAQIAFLSCGQLASRRLPPRLASYGLNASASWFEPPRGLRTWRRAPLRGARPSSGFGPASEFDPRSVAPVLADAGTLTRFLAPTTLPTRRDPPLPSFSCPGHVTPSHLPCASAPFSLGGLPGVLSTRCAHGTDPSELLPSEICATFQQRFPSCDWRPTASADTRPAISHLTRLAAQRAGSSDRPPKARPSRFSGASCAFGA
jgi:hypothetical protein